MEQCTLCPNLSFYHKNGFNKEYCDRVGIKFVCDSCLFPQYRYTLRTSVRGNINKLYKQEDMREDEDKLELLQSLLEESKVSQETKEWGIRNSVGYVRRNYS